MSRVPYEFRQRLAEHNRNCWIAVAFSALGACVGWFLLFVLFSGAVLLIEAARTGEMILVRPPDWVPTAGLGGVALMLIWTAVERWRTRYRLPSDRPIIGGHLFPEFLLLPPRMTFAILDHFSARITLRRREVEEAWRLLMAIFERGRAEVTMLAMEFPDGRQLSRLLIALQLTDWIDLHRGDEDWFYRVRSDEVAGLRKLLPEEEPEELA